MPILFLGWPQPNETRLNSMVGLIEFGLNPKKTLHLVFLTNRMCVMNLKPLILLLAMVLAACSPSKKPEMNIPSIIPKPSSIRQSSGNIAIGKQVDIITKSVEAKQVAALLQDFLHSKGIEGQLSETDQSANSIRLSVEGNGNPEGYSLTVDEGGIVIKASSGAGLFYGMQTFMQLFPVDDKENTTVPFLNIEDAPRFPYRGLHLDVGRHMFPVAFIKKYIDLLAHHKLNRFHWHLTEDQGWRIEIKKYPKLQEVGAYRKETAVGHAGTADRAKPMQFDGQRYGGYYTQEEIKDVVKYAADRYVTVIPEIELPGHALAALAAYPGLGCTGGPYEVATKWGVFDDVYCAGKEETFHFLQDVIDEVVELFPGKYIHIGGDECPKAKWEQCPYCQKRMRDEKLKDVHALQSYFIQRMEKYINSKGRQIIGWDEILEGGLAPNATVMSWRGEEGGIAAASQNHDVIMTPGKWVYLDYYQDTSKTEPLAIGGYLPVSKVYSYEPIPPQLTPEQAQHILGVQSNVWTEYMKTSDYVEYMVYPRACALAEVAWSSRENRDYGDFVKRFAVHAKRLDDWHVNYARHILKED